MKFLVLSFFIAGLTAAADLSCPTGQTLCGNGCITGTCCDQASAKFCHIGETCTTISGIIGCCPEGKTCTSTAPPSCLDASNTRCTGSTPDSICCPSATPYCSSDSGLCVATRGSGPLGSTYQNSGYTSKVDASSTIKAAPTAAAAGPSDVLDEFDGGVEIENDGEVSDEEYEVEEVEAPPMTRTEVVESTSTISIKLCDECTTSTLTNLVPVATTEPESEDEDCETFTRTKIIPVSTIYEATSTPKTTAVPTKNATRSLPPQVTPSLPPQQQIGAGSKMGGSIGAVVMGAVAVLLML